MLDANTMQWLERRKIGMCCRCENYADCQWIPQPRGHFQTAQCWRFKSSDGYCIDKNDYMDAAEFEARVAVKLATVICAGCEDFNKKNVCPLAIYQARGIYECRMKHARLAVEREMIAEGKVPGKKEEDNGRSSATSTR